MTEQMAESAREYVRKGLRPIPVEGKNQPARKAWQTLEITEAEVGEFWDNGQNIALINDGIAAVDGDCDEAVRLAGRFLDPTLTAGHGECLELHWWYLIDAGGWYKRFKDLDGTTTLVELRATSGHYTLVAPSLHSDGGRYRWANSGLEMAEADLEDLKRRVRMLSTAALIARHLPAHRSNGGGGRHDLALCLCGLMLKDARLDTDVVLPVLSAAWDCKGFPSERDRRDAFRDLEDAVKNTDARLRGGEKCKGGRELETMVPGLASKIADYWDWSERPEPTEPSTEAYELTDVGNAYRFVGLHGQDVRWCPHMKAFLAWDGRRWAVDERHLVVKLAQETARSIHHEAAATEDRDEQRKLVRFALASQNASRIYAMLDQAKPHIVVGVNELDTDSWLLNCQNGTLDLRTGKLGAHRREDYTTKLAPVAYDPEATAPSFAAFLERVLPSEELRRFVQRIVGCSLTGDVSEQVLFFLYGAGANGKSTLINVILALLGDYGQQAAPELLVAKAGAHPTEIADLKGARFAACVEVEDGHRLAEALVKHLTGGDPMKARFMRQDFFEFDPTHKIVLAANHKPVIRGTDHAIWRRIKLVPFEVTIPKEEQDTHLLQELREELPGILAWAVRGCLEWREHGLGEPDEVTNATNAYRSEMDVLAAFIEDECVVHEKARVQAAKLHEVYAAWCTRSRD
jgi:P4 family phage/plasmid primase-like protien